MQVLTPETDEIDAMQAIELLEIQPLQEWLTCNILQISQ